MWDAISFNRVEAIGVSKLADRRPQIDDNEGGEEQPIDGGGRESEAPGSLLLIKPGRIAD